MNSFDNNPWNSNIHKKNEEDEERNSNNFNFYKNNLNIKKLTSTIIFIAIVLWLASGMYIVDTNEQAVVLYFEKFNSVKKSGLNYDLPYPISKIYKVATEKINKEEFGFNNKSKTSKLNMDMENLMLTGDENIVDIDFEVQWKIKDVKGFLFSLIDLRNTIRMVSESAMREVIGKRPINDVLANKKSDIEYEVLNLIQSILDNYKSGIEIVLVQLLRVDPPEQVIDAFRDVQTAKADKERKINEAETYRNDMLPKARGEAEIIIKDAEGYKESIVKEAEGEVERFYNIYSKYKLNKDLTKKIIYLDTINDVLKNNEKIIIDKNISNNILQHMSINEVKQ